MEIPLCNDDEILSKMQKIRDMLDDDKTNPHTVISLGLSLVISAISDLKKFEVLDEDYSGFTKNLSNNVIKQLKQAIALVLCDDKVVQ